MKAEYFDYLQGEVKGLRFGVSAGRTAAASLAVKSFDDLSKVMETIRQSPCLKRPELRGELRKELGNFDDQSLNLSIDFSLRLLYMINVQAPEFQNLTPQTPVLPWNDDKPMQSFISSLFPDIVSDIKPREGRLHPYFTAANMHRICNLKIEWTDSLEDHLRLDRRANALRVFPHKRCLLQMQEAPKKGIQTIIPESIITESILSLELLFPHWDERTDKLLRQQKKTFHHIGPSTGPRPLNLQEFKHWRERLLELYEEIFLSPPASWAQLWSDRRSPQQWLTFWLALVIALLTVISTVATVAQTVKAFQS